MAKKYYLVGRLVKAVTIYGTFNLAQSVPLVWDEGMVGGCPVYSNKKKAKACAGKNYEIFEIYLKESNVRK